MEQFFHLNFSRITLELNILLVFQTRVVVYVLSSTSRLLLDEEGPRVIPIYVGANNNDKYCFEECK